MVGWDRMVYFIYKINQHFMLLYFIYKIKQHTFLPMYDIDVKNSDVYRLVVSNLIDFGHYRREKKIVYFIYKIN